MFCLPLCQHKMYQTFILQIVTLTWVFVGAVVGDWYSSERECTDTRRVNYGDLLEFKVTVAPTLLLFYPANDASKGIKLWSSNKPSEGEVWCTRIDYECHFRYWFVSAKEGEIWYVRKMRATQKDQGMYVVRQEGGGLICKSQIFVQVKNQSRKVNASQDVKITFEHMMVTNYDLTFHPKNQPQSITELVKNGVALSNRVDDVWFKGVTLKNVQFYDSGTYQAFDKEGNLFLTLELTVKSELKHWRSYGGSFKDLVVPFSCVLFVLCCCGCLADRARSEDAEPPPASNQIEEELMQHQPPSQPTSTLTSEDRCPPSYDQVQHPAFSKDPGLDDKGPSYTMPSEPAFELDDLSNVQVPLSPSAPTCDVYTSDKLNLP